VPLDGGAVHRALLSGGELLFGIEELARRAVPTFVLRQVEIAIRFDPPDELENALFMPRRGGAAEIVV